MSRLLDRLSPILYRKFTICWVAITFIILAFALYFNWSLNLQESLKANRAAATFLANKADRLFEDLFQDIYSIPLYEKKISDCKKQLYPYLERIIINNPKISGLIISVHNELLCSTLANTNNSYLSSKPGRTLLGPFIMPRFDQPVYVIQQKIGPYSIGIVVLQSLIRSILTTNSSYSSVGLYNQEQQKFIVLINDDSISDLTVVPDTSKSIYAEDRLHSIDKMKVVIFEFRSKLLRQQFYKEFLAGLFVILLSSLLYLLAKSMIARHYSLLTAMKLGIKNKEFYPEYQPLFNYATGKYSGVEVLLRWQDNQDEIIMPDFFIQEAEITGIIVPISLQIIEIAFKDTKTILANHPEFHLAFNISALHFIDAHFFAKFNQLAKEYAISASQIVFEITERDLLDKNNGIFIQKMQELRKQGFSLAVDDYGTGHASINYLHHFPFNYLKIDKQFIQAIGTRAITESLNAAIIDMAKQLNLIIIAEGVETEEQFKYLTKNGVQFLQGWYFSKAISIEHLSNLLQGDKNGSL